MTCRKRSLLLIMCLLASFAAGPGRATAEEARASEIYRRTLRSTAWVVVPLGNGNVSRGTAWVADRSERLLVTNQHVVGNQTAALVLFPAYRGGQVIAEKASYDIRKGLPARVVATAVHEDLAVLQVDALPEGIEALPLAARSPEPGETVYSVGNPGVSGALWVFTAGQVRAVYHKRFPTVDGKEVIWREARVVETSSPTNPGDSGGPVVNTRGELVAITESGLTTAQLVTTFIDVGEVHKFLAEARRILHPGGVDDYYQQGDRFERAGRYEEAIAAYSEVIRRSPQSQSLLSWAYLGRGNCWFAKKDYDTAIADYTEAIRLDPRCATAYNNRGNTWNSKGQYDRASNDLTQAIQLNPDYALAFLNRANTKMYQRQYESAIVDYTRAIALFSKEPGPDYFLAFNGRGLCYMELKSYDAAYADFTEALDRDPFKAFVWANRGEAQFQRKRYDQAVQDALKAIDLNPNDAISWNILGEVAMAKGDYNSAVTAYTRAIQCDPRNFCAWSSRGEAQHCRKHEDEALQDAYRALELNPNDAYTWNIVAEVAHAKGDYNRAIEAYTKAIRCDARNAYAYYYRGRAYQALGYNAWAQSDYAQAASLDPKYARQGG